jgi:hypothetical protein
MKGLERFRARQLPVRSDSIYSLSLVAPIRKELGIERVITNRYICEKLSLGLFWEGENEPVSCGHAGRFCAESYLIG